MHPVTSAGRPSTACKHCRAQKVRCSGDLPSCKRCLRLRRHCLYPENLSCRADAACAGNPQAPHQQVKPGQAGETSPFPNRHAFLVPESASDDARSSAATSTRLGVPHQLVLDLIDTFFTHAYNAHLLLHKETFLQEHAAGTVQQHVLLSICAFAAIFHRDPSGHNSLKQHGFASGWAETAARLVLGQVETPNEDNIVSFLTLALFWYSCGNWRRSYIHKGNAMQTAHILKLANNRKHNLSPLKAELSRRRFWACYLMNCHTSDSMFAIDPPRVIANLPLPWSEADFSAGVSTQPPVLLNSPSRGTSIYAELVRAMSFWSDTHNLIKSPDTTSDARLTAIYHLNTRLSQWWSSLPQAFRSYSPDTSSASGHELPRLVLIQVLYFQCLCALHSSIVPLYSWGEEQNMPGLALQLSAQIAYDNACAVSELFHHLLQHSNDMSNFPSFLGYAAYCGCAIQIPFMRCSDMAVRERATRNVQGNLQIIRRIGQNWKFVALLGNYAEYIMTMHARNPLDLENEPKWLPPDKLNGFRIIASKARASILGHNSVLWKDDGVSVQGDEVTDLGFGNEQPESESSSQTEKASLAHDVCNMEKVLVHAPDEPSRGRLAGQGDSSLTTCPPSEEFFQPLLDASDLFELLPDYEFPVVGDMLVNDEWQQNSVHQ